jgi:hypothetical protein
VICECGFHFKSWWLYDHVFLKNGYKAICDLSFLFPFLATTKLHQIAG